MPLQHSEPNDSKNSKTLLLPKGNLWLFAIRVYQRTMRWRQTPFSVPQSGEDLPLPPEAMLGRSNRSDPDNLSVSEDEIFTVLDLDSPEVQRAKLLQKNLSEAKERMAHGLAIQPEWEPFSSLPLSLRTVQVIRRIEEGITLHAVPSETKTTTRDKTTGRQGDTESVQRGYRNMRLRMEKMLLGRVIWSAESLLVPVSVDQMDEALAMFMGPTHIFQRMRLVVQEKTWQISLWDAPMLPFQEALVEVVGLLPISNFTLNSRTERLILPKMGVELEPWFPGSPEASILSTFREALAPVDGQAQTFWLPYMEDSST